MNQTTNAFSFNVDSGGGGEAWVTAVAVLGLVEIVLVVLCIAGLWKVFSKAGQPGWAAIIPIYNAIVLLNVAGKPIWFILLLCIPFVNVIFSIIVMAGLAKNFGKGIGFLLGLILLPFIFLPILGFGGSRYEPVE